MKHIQAASKSIPRTPAKASCCPCLSQTGNNLYKCTKQGQCPPGWRGACMEIVMEEQPPRLRVLALLERCAGLLQAASAGNH